MDIKKIKKIIIISPNLNIGGAERNVVVLANHFIKKKFDVEIILFQKRGDYLDDLNESIKINNFKCNRAIFSFRKFYNFFSSNDEMIIISTQFYINIIVLFFKVFFHKRNIFIIRESSTASLNIKSYPFLKKYIFKKLILFFYPFADLIISPSKGVKSDLINEFKINDKKIEVVYNPIDIDYINKKSIENISEINNLFFKKKIIIGIGRLDKNKNFHDLILAFYKIQKKHNVSLLIIGDGVEKNKLINLINEYKIKDKVILLGNHTNPFKFLSKSDIFVLNSNYEGMPNVLLQAAYLDNYIISTNCKSGPSEVLKYGEFGKLIPMNSPDDLVVAIEDCLNNSIDKIPKKILINTYSSDIMINQYIELFNNKSFL